MTENRFDALLRDALLDANWLECRTVWEEAEEPDFSPTYLRWRRDLLADPFGFVKRKLRPVWVRALRMAACIVLISAVALGTLMAVSPTVRAAVLNWLREISGNYMTYTSGQSAQTDALPSNWRITWLPEGWELRELTSNGQIYEEPSSQGGLTFACAPPGDSQMATNVYDVEDADVVRSTIQVQGADADYYESEAYRVLLWENVPYALQRIRDVMNRNQLCVVPPKSSETEQKSPVSLHIIFGFSQARTATQSTPYPVPNEMPLEDQDELSLSPKQLAWPRYLLWRRPQW